MELLGIRKGQTNAFGQLRKECLLFGIHGSNRRMIRHTVTRRQLDRRTCSRSNVGKTWGFGGSPQVLASEGGPINNALCYGPPTFNPLVGGTNPPRPTNIQGSRFSWGLFL